MAVRLWLRRFLQGSPVVSSTILVLVAAYVAVLLAIRIAGVDLYALFELVPTDVFGGGWRVWTLVTYALLHSAGSPLHLVFNCLVLYWFGRELEVRWGSKRIAAFLFLTVLAGGLAIVLTRLAGLSSASTVLGASAAAAGAVVAWGLVYRDREVFFFLFRMKGITLVYVSIGFELLNALSFSAVSAAGHFGGMIGGALFMSLVEPSPLRRAWLRFRLKRLQAQSQAQVVMKPRRGGGFVPELRVIRGEKSDEPPKDKRYLN